jgi:hypothetical protein
MSTEAEIAAGKAAYELKVGPYGAKQKPFESIEYEDERAAWIKDGMTIVHAYQRAAWREPTSEDRKSGKPLITTYTYMSSAPPGTWSEWSVPYVSSKVSNSNQFDTIHVQDLPPLPEPKS